MIVERSMNPDYLSNTYLIGEGSGGEAAIVDTGGPMGPILAAIERHRLVPRLVLCTHHHGDHVAHNADYRERFGCPILAHREEARWLPGLDRRLEDGEELRCGELRIRAIHVPGHTRGQLAFLIDGVRIFTGDTLFRGSVGGTLGPGASGFEDLRRSVMKVLMRLAPQTIVHPGHTDETTIAAEWEGNPFVRAWRGLEPVAPRPCTVAGRPAALLLRAPDYDGGTKCWVRFEADDEQAIVGGSRVREAS